MNKRLPRIAINGFGRIGRAIAKLNALNPRFELVLINDINPHIDNLCYLFKYDSTYGRFEGDAESIDGQIIINGNKSACTSFSDLTKANLEQFQIDVLINSTGVEETVCQAKSLVDSGDINKTIVTHCSPGVELDCIMGVNDHEIKAHHRIVSSSICDANAIAHVLKWIDDEYGITSGALTTLHPWLSYQNLVDGPAISQSIPGIVWKEYALGRASTDSLIPKNTTAMSAVERVLPALKNRIFSFSYRVPTDIVASADITLNLDSDIEEPQFKAFLENQSRNSKYVQCNKESLISLDYEKVLHSATIDLPWTKANGRLVKLILWYDNEWAYSARVLDLAELLARIE